MNILLVEPFFSGSHRQWAEGYRRHSRHEVTLLTLPGRYWKWRMFGGAVSLANQYLRRPLPADVLLTSDMLDLGAFLGLTRRRLSRVPAVVYFHENQITYPWSPADPDIRLERNHQYGFLNFTSALAADAVCFNSEFHRRAFFDSLPAFLGRFPDYQELETIDHLEQKSRVLPLGLDLAGLDVEEAPPKPEEAVLLWNHRWEYDKDPDTFFRQLFRLKAEGVPFRLIVLGRSYREAPPVFAEARQRLAGEIIHWGYAGDRKAYARLLRQADILPVTSRQEFFGASVIEAIHCNCLPLLPDRLSYPGHLPPHLYGQYLYQEEEELYRKLRSAIADLAAVRRQRYQDFAAPYDWRTLASQYDTFFENLSI